MDRTELERLDRERLVTRAQAAGIKRARLLTRPELIDELLRRDPVVDESQLKKSRGFFGVARDLLSRVVERGLHLPDAADRLRAALGSPLPQVPRPEPQAVPTVTLAEIYAAQGHKARAIETLQRVLESEPDHAAARTLLETLLATDYVPPAPPELPPEVEPPSPQEIEDDEIDQEAVATLDPSRMSEPEGAAAAGGPVDPAPRTASGPSEVSEEAAVSTVDGEAESEDAPTVEPATAHVAARRPQRFDVPDEAEPVPPSACYAVPGPMGYYVWWRLSPEAAKRAAAGRFVVRAAVFFPTWDGPRTDRRDVAANPSAGELILHGLPGRAVVRIAVGLVGRSEDEFAPLAHSPAIELSEQGLVAWSLEGRRPMSFPDPKLGERVARAIAASAQA